ncbi:MAG: hypothetical protein V9F82_07345 [Dermatophilaceae bacterium]
MVFGYKTGRPSFSANIRAHKVAHLSSTVRSLAEAHLLTGNRRGGAVRCGRFCCASRSVTRAGSCTPAYGEYADMDPRVASQFINKLPEPELCPPPNKPDRRLHTGYWTAGRATGGGQESWFVRRMVEAYDFTCEAKEADGTPLYTDAERRLIERDLLLEGTVLLVSDKQINNKSVGNRTAAALVGLCVGHPGLVRFGWDGFQQTIDEWFLPDGTTSESPAYAMMTLHNVWDMPQALRGYTEPAGYRGPDGKRRVAVDLYHGTAYERIWENCFKGLQGDLTFPAYADSYRDTRIGSNFLELMAANYPERPEYLALLKETCGEDLAKGYAPLALYYREPGLEKKLDAAHRAAGLVRAGFAHRPHAHGHRWARESAAAQREPLGESPPSGQSQSHLLEKRPRAALRPRLPLGSSAQTPGLAHGGAPHGACSMKRTR